MASSPGDTAAWLGFRAPLVSAPGAPAVAADSATGRTHALIVPVTNYASLPDIAKWLLTLGMLLGRLEIFTLLVVMTPAFWRK
mgnify:CR=1 FL=1